MFSWGGGLFGRLGHGMLEQYFRMPACFQADVMQAPSQPTPRFKAFKRGSQMPTAPQTRHDSNSVVRFKAFHGRQVRAIAASHVASPQREAHITDSLSLLPSFPPALLPSFPPSLSLSTYP